MAFIKSKDWMYEEEHRFLIDLNYSNITLVEDTPNNRIELNKYDVSVDLIEGKLAVPPNHKFKSLDGFLPGFNCFLDRSKYMQFVSIKDTCVTGIYFGAKMPEEKLNDIVSANKKLAKFKNLNGNLYRATVHSDIYDLEFDKL